MAGFQTHLTVGAFTGYAAGAAAAVLQWATMPVTCFFIFAGAFIGAFLPDLDSDHSRPFGIIFGFFAILGGALVFLHCLQQERLPWTWWIWLPPGAALLIRFGVGNIFRRYTVHRGIFHSIPALLIATFATPLLLSGFPFEPSDILMISLGVGAGYLSHLILDELFSVIDFDGGRIAPKRSLGSALTFVGPTRRVTLAAYIILVLTVSASWHLIIIFSRSLPWVP